MLSAFVYSVLRLLLDVVDVRLRVRDPEAELLLLRHQLRVVRRQVKRPQLGLADRAMMAALSRLVSRAALVGMLVQPETVLGWHRALVRRKWCGVQNLHRVRFRTSALPLCPSFWPQGLRPSRVATRVATRATSTDTSRHLAV
jgi:hypothetical protein